jgi:hypothetical protein
MNLKNLIFLVGATALLAVGAGRTAKPIEQRFVARGTTLCRSMGGQEFAQAMNGYTWLRCEGVAKLSDEPIGQVPPPATVTK